MEKAWLVVAPILRSLRNFVLTLHHSFPDPVFLGKCFARWEFISTILPGAGLLHGDQCVLCPCECSVLVVVRKQDSSSPSVDHKADEQKKISQPQGKPVDLKKWLTIQLGSREHYAIPRVLDKQGQLSGLLTDSWIRSEWQSVVSKASKSLAQRHHVDLPDNKVKAPTLQRIAFDVSLQARKTPTWDGIYQRNQWFQQWSAKQVLGHAQPADVCFSYSYTARLPFQAAKNRGMSCILGQIDPGPLEQAVVDEMTSQYASLKLDEAVPSKAYWDEWQDELELADRVIVNSAWSHELLIRQGVADSKIRVIPLAYEGFPSNPKSGRNRPNSLSSPRPLVVLFLGQVILRKGVGQLFDAIRKLHRVPMRFIFAGPVGVKIPSDIAANPKVEILGAVDRKHACELYRNADVFILPTLSDGFAITQLEAFAYGIPVIASKACGAVVTHGVDGLLLDEIIPEEIVKCLMRLVDEPALLDDLKSAVSIPNCFSHEVLGKSLHDLTI
jgi:glycosyltransferase involved in cell wall biosynthesis